MTDHLSSTRDIILSLENTINQTIIGQRELVRHLLIALFARGHVLIEGVPGLGKTELVKTLARVLGYDFARVSFTPDLLPSDLTGHEIYVKEKGKFEIRRGPVFTEILLADEINRTPPKVQSALLEAMEEGSVTIAGQTLDLPRPFFSIATENPLEHEGVYPLPEALLDRFLMKLVITYPSPEDEKQIFAREAVHRGQYTEDSTKQGILSQSQYKGESQKSHTSIPAYQLTPEAFLEIQDYIEESIHIDPKIYDYVSALLEATRSRGGDHDVSSKGRSSPTSYLLPPTSYLSYGASTRAGLALIRTARVRALLEGRDYVLPDDIAALALPILRHRIGLSYEAIAKKISPDQIVREIVGVGK